MPAVFFHADEVRYCEAPFAKVRLGFNKDVGALNMIHSPHDSALVLVSDVAGLEVNLEGKTCAVGCKVRATFKSEADAMKFAALLQEPVEAEVGQAAPSTPVRRPSKKGMDMTPARCVRPRRGFLLEDECEMLKEDTPIF